MKKRVNVILNKNSRGIFTVKPAILRTAMGIELTPVDIKRCILGRALVEEILNDGTIVTLNMSNYDKDNNPKVVEQPKKEYVKPILKEEPAPVVVEVKEEPKVEEVVKEEVVKENDVEVLDEVVATEQPQSKEKNKKETHKYNYKKK